MCGLTYSYGGQESRPAASTAVPGRLQINSETDFVARNDQFKSLLGSVATAALQLSSAVKGMGIATLGYVKNIWWDLGEGQ